MNAILLSKPYFFQNKIVFVNLHCQPFCFINNVITCICYRCAQGIDGLRDQGAINQVVYKFIAHYNSLFRDENEDPPELHWVRNS